MLSNPRRRITASGAVRYFAPEDPCCLYRFFDDAGAVIYVGITHDPATRMRAHYGKQPWAGEIARSELAWHPNKAAAQCAERAAVEQFNPRYNVVHTDEHRIRSVAHMPQHVQDRMAQRIAAEQITKGVSRTAKHTG